MKKIICKKEYDTSVATLVKRYAVGNFGDADGFEESLYQMPDGAYFIYTNGGEASQFPTEDIKRLSAKKAEEWLAAHE